MILLLQILPSLGTYEKEIDQHLLYFISQFQQCMSDLDCYGLDYCSCCSLKAMSWNDENKDTECCLHFNSILQMDKAEIKKAADNINSVKRLKESLDNCASFQVNNIEIPACSWTNWILLMIVVAIGTCCTTFHITEILIRHQKTIQRYVISFCVMITITLILIVVFYILKCFDMI